ncbi:hypothetical protein EXIGLDRAFT_335966 [Exidia glandulosa HHB12029]|uniref:Uncharacterized protein n=1 Tax=Exidia glandulosa HHB12029 TaxID=1314781 RepID=A0A165CLF7_EXIGL|nr:hypothetical protein EXIGLDRAFT_335966 [Exidia glandulosa HHB12029]
MQRGWVGRLHEVSKNVSFSKIQVIQTVRTHLLLVLEVHTSASACGCTLVSLWNSCRVLESHAQTVGFDRQTRGHSRGALTGLAVAEGMKVAEFDGMREKTGRDAPEDRGRILQNGDFYETPLSCRSDTAQDERDGGSGRDVCESIEGEIGRNGGSGRGESSAR